MPILLAAIIGSVSFWGSNIAFGKLQEILPGRPIQLPGQQIVNIVLLLVVVGCAVAIAAGTESELLFLAIRWARPSSATCSCSRSAGPTCRW